MPKDAPPCPNCSSHDVIPVVFGLPGNKLMEMSERGEVWLGGCWVSENDPEWRCQACGKFFGSKDNLSRNRMREE